MTHWRQGFLPHWGRPTNALGWQPAGAAVSSTPTVDWSAQRLMGLNQSSQRLDALTIDERHLHEENETRLQLKNQWNSTPGHTNSGVGT